MLINNRILLGISGGIASYKSLFLIRLFIKNGLDVKVIATKNALKFVTPISIETLSKNKIYTDVFKSPEEYSIEHISISDECDVLVVAPATANIIGKFACGIADDALSTTFLAFNKPVIIAPAMNSKMYNHPAVVANMQILKQRGVRFLEPDSGHLACGHEGVGRMAEPESIFEEVLAMLSYQQKLKGKKVVVTAGPTYESIDLVRYIGNHSSGKMGFALAEEFVKTGADVTLISGPVTLSTPIGVKRIDVTNAEQMCCECVKLMPNTDIVVMAAAVADYRPETTVLKKIKKSESSINLKLFKTVDILEKLGAMKRADQLLVGFALESEDEINQATKKLHTKNLDFIVLNSLNDKGAGFNHDSNKITIIDRTEKMTAFHLKSKRQVSTDIVSYVIQLTKSDL